MTSHRTVGFGELTGKRGRSGAGGFLRVAGVLFFVACTISFLDAAPLVLFVSIDTSTFNGVGGNIDLQFNPGDNSTQTATAQITDYSGSSFSGVAQTIGDVGGDLPGTLLFDNGSAFNDYYRPVIFGSILRLTLTIDGPAVESPTGTATSGSSFGIGIFDNASPNPNPILTTDPNGFIAAVNLDINGLASITTFPSDGNGGLPAAEIVGAPEPATLVLFLTALGGLFATRVRAAFRIGTVPQEVLRMPLRGFGNASSTPTITPTDESR